MLNPLDVRPTALLLLIQLGTAWTNEHKACELFDKMLNKGEKCGFRHESQYDFAEMYQANACVNHTYCLCQKTIYVRYMTYPPYVYKENMSSREEGLLPGKCLFLS